MKKIISTLSAFVLLMTVATSTVVSAKEQPSVSSELADSIQPRQQLGQLLRWLGATAGGIYHNAMDSTGQATAYDVFLSRTNSISRIARRF